MKSISRALFLVATVLTGIVMFHPYLDFQSLLAQGDIGRDLYCFKQTLDGAKPYQDYWWVYGPLMPYFYALFFKIFGIGITSVLLGKFICMICAGIFFYLILSEFISPAWSWLGTIWLWTFNPDFFHTYNHIGAVVCLLAVLFILSRYIKRPSMPLLFIGLELIVILALIKFNIGVAALVAYGVSILLIDIRSRILSRARFVILFLSVALTLLAIVLIYGYFLNGLPIHYIRQCFPILKSDYPYHDPLWQSFAALMTYVWLQLTLNVPNFILGVLMILSVWNVIFQFKKGSLGEPNRKDLSLILGILSIFMFFLFHEFVGSGVLYTAFWVTPLLFAFFYLLIVLSSRPLTRSIRLLLFTALFLFVFLENTSRFRFMSNMRNADQYLPIKSLNIFVLNPPDWGRTVMQTTQFLKDNLKSDETFFALPYDPLYYFLTDRVSPTKYLIFFDHIRIQPSQEEEIISDLKSKDVRFVLMSSFAYYPKASGGVFGKTYTPLLAKFIEESFTPLRSFGDWTKEPGWAWNHATMIFKRNKD